jgi:hypothetical protein
MGKRATPRAYDMYLSRTRELFPQRWKVTARFTCVISDKRVDCVRIHGFPGGQVVHLDTTTFLAKFKRLEAKP